MFTIRKKDGIVLSMMTFYLGCILNSYTGYQYSVNDVDVDVDENVLVGATVNDFDISEYKSGIIIDYNEGIDLNDLDILKKYLINLDGDLEGNLDSGLNGED